MSEDYLELLKSADSAIYTERLPGFNRKKADAKFNDFVKALERRLSCALPDKENCIDIQDASFHGMVFLPYEFLTEEYRASVRVSNFGNFATVYDADEVVQPRILAIIKELLAEFGYIYIPTEMLNEPYTGQNPVIGFRTWGDRYFDWT